MSNLVIMHGRQAVTTSVQVAETFGKRHDHTMRAIDELKKDVPNFGEMFSEDYEPDAYGRDRRIYYMTHDGFTLLAMGFTGRKATKFKLEYINAFHELETATHASLPQTPEEMLRLTMQVSTRTVERVDKLDERLDDIEARTLLSPGEYNFIARSVNRTVAGWINDHNLLLTAKQRSPFYRDINRGLAEYLGIRTRTQILMTDFDKACEFILNWIPSTAVTMEAHSIQTELIKKHREGGEPNEN
jgi:Rha family phage regulatory protein